MPVAWKSPKRFAPARNKCWRPCRHTPYLTTHHSHPSLVSCYSVCPSSSAPARWAKSLWQHRGALRPLGVRHLRLHLWLTRRPLASTFSLNSCGATTECHSPLGALLCAPVHSALWWMCRDHGKLEHGTGGQCFFTPPMWCVVLLFRENRTFPWQMRWHLPSRFLSSFDCTAAKVVCCVPPLLHFTTSCPFSLTLSCYS